MRTSFCSLITLLLLLSVSLAASQDRGQAAAALLEEHYDDGSEMAQRIVSEFLVSEQCLQQCSRMAEGQLLTAFEEFRSAWVAHMVDVVIAELGLDQESANLVRRDPASFMISYETFKLLTFQ